LGATLRSGREAQVEHSSEDSVTAGGASLHILGKEERYPLSHQNEKTIVAIEASWDEHEDRFTDLGEYGTNILAD